MKNDNFEGEGIIKEKIRIPKYVFFLTGLLIVILITYGLFHFAILQIPSFDKYITTDVVDEPPVSVNYGLTEVVGAVPVLGTILFTGRPSVDGSTEMLKTYSLRGFELTPKIEPRTQSSAVSAFGEFENNNNPRFGYVVTVSEESTLDQIAAGKIITPEIHTFDLLTRKAAFIKSASGSLSRQLAWSSSVELLAFTRATRDITDYLDIADLETWEVVVVDPETDSLIHVFKNAVLPKWSPDGRKLLMMKADGVHLYDFDLEQSFVVIETVGSGADTLSTESMYDISPDGNYLIWTTPKSGLITVKEITSWEPFNVQELGRIVSDNTEYYWPQFSPDGEYYTVQAIDGIGKGPGRTNPRFEIRLTKGREVLHSESLEEFDFNALFTDGWVVSTE